MAIRGRVWRFGDNVDTDVIAPARYLDSPDPQDWAAHTMEPLDPEFAKKVARGDIIVAGENFGCGSSREHAPIALKWAGIEAVVAESIARIFFRNAINNGLAVLECKGISEETRAGDELEIDLRTGEIKNLTTDQRFRFVEVPDFILEIIAKGGLVPYLLARRQ
jgi:3-isopropylmalate/(R)-2-methylmalate dehydratase small subunit